MSSSSARSVTRTPLESRFSPHSRVTSSSHRCTAPTRLRHCTDCSIWVSRPSSLHHRSSAVVSQRLLRKMCDNCREPYTPGADELAVFRQHSGGSEKTTFFHGVGCSYCSGTGVPRPSWHLRASSRSLPRSVVSSLVGPRPRSCAVWQLLKECEQCSEKQCRTLKTTSPTIQEVVRTLFAH